MEFSINPTPLRNQGDCVEFVKEIRGHNTYFHAAFFPTFDGLRPAF